MVKTLAFNILKMPGISLKINNHYTALICCFMLASMLLFSACTTHKHVVSERQRTIDIQSLFASQSIDDTIVIKPFLPSFEINKVYNPDGSLNIPQLQPCSIIKHKRNIIEIAAVDSAEVQGSIEKTNEQHISKNTSKMKRHKYLFFLIVISISAIIAAGYKIHHHLFKNSLY